MNIKTNSSTPFQLPSDKEPLQNLIAKYSGHNENILLVDDNAAVREMMGSTLERFGYRVITASNGMEALTIYSKDPASINLVLTDIMMPIMDGLQLITELSNMDPSLPIIAMSGYADPIRLSRSNAFASIPFLDKPFPIRQLLGAIANQLNETKRS